MNRAEGSERMFYHPDVNGRPESCPLKATARATTFGRATSRPFGDDSGCRTTSSDHVPRAMRAHPALNGAKQTP